MEGHGRKSKGYAVIVVIGAQIARVSDLRQRVVAPGNRRSRAYPESADTRGQRPDGRDKSRR
jgi:hypothetical protein